MSREKIFIYGKPTCNTCRAAIKTLRESGEDFEAVNYYEKPFTHDGLRQLISRLQITPHDLLRTKEKIYAQLKLGEKNLTDDEIIETMLRYPDLIQRPIVVKGNKSVLARPAERIKEILR